MATETHRFWYKIREHGWPSIDDILSRLTPRLFGSLIVQLWNGTETNRMEWNGGQGGGGAKSTCTFLVRGVMGSAMLRPPISGRGSCVEEMKRKRKYQFVTHHN